MFISDYLLAKKAQAYASFCLGVAICTIAAAKASAQGYPTNDNLAAASVIVGSTGVTYGDNINATAEAGEPPPDALETNAPQATVWYLWTAPTTTTMDFSTRGSTDPNTGDQLATVMAVYALKSAGGLTYANLKPALASNVMDPSGYLTSRVDLPVTVGQQYLIQIDGATNGSGGVAEGYLELNWAPSLVGGTFTFSADIGTYLAGEYYPGPMTYFAGEYDDVLYWGGEPQPIDPSLHNAEGTNNVRITVVRQGGYTGKCEVTLYLTNTLYQNTLFTNLNGSNVVTTIIDTNSGTETVSNYFFTNIVSENELEDHTIGVGTAGAGNLVTLPVYGVSQSSFTTPGPLTTVVENLTNLPIQTNFWANFPTATPNNNYTNILPATTNGTVITFQSIQYFSVNLPTLTNMTPTASNGVDYAPYSNVLVFNDFQMSQDVYLQVNPNLLSAAKGGNVTGLSLAGPDWPANNGQNLYYGINPVVAMILTNPQLDPEEDPDITPPTISPNGSLAYLDILTMSGNPNNAAQDGPYLSSSMNQPVTINFERATFRADKPAYTPNTNSPYSTKPVYLYLSLTGNPGSGDVYTVNYTIDDKGAALTGTPPGADVFAWNWFPTTAGADYAQSGHYNATNYDFNDPVDNPTDVWNYPGVGGGNTTWSGNYGSFTIGPFNPGTAVTDAAEIAVPIYNWGATEFDQDMVIQLFIAGNASDNPNLKQKVPGFIGNISSAHLTIEYGGPQPGGAYDLTFNPANATNSQPTFDATPGANPPRGGAVEAIALQTNGQAIIGGNFTSYNTTSIYGIARLQANGWLDSSFNNVSLGGVNGTVRAIAIDAGGNIIIGGEFSSYDGDLTPTENIARLTPSGALDTSFNTGSGFNGVVDALCVDASGNIVVGGSFTSYNSANVNHIVRLLPNGTLDPNFYPNTGNGLANYGTDLPVLAVATDTYGHVILGGQFSLVNGSALNYLARLNTNGSVDASFSPGVGPDNDIYAVTIETNNGNEILIGGAFENYNLASTPHLALITYSGSLDTTFPVGTGADGNVYSIDLQTNGEVVIGGDFRNFNTTRRLGVARLLQNGWVDTSFLDTSYNQFAGLVNSYYAEAPRIAYAVAVQPDGNILVGGSFTNVGGGATRNTNAPQINITRLIGQPTAGPMTGGGDGGGLNNYPGNITLTQDPYATYDTSGKCYITLDREYGSLGPAQVTLGTNLLQQGPGAASPNDFSLILPGDTPFYNEVRNHWTFTKPGIYGWRVADGYYGMNILPSTDTAFGGIEPTTDYGDSALNLNIFNNPTSSQNLTADLSLLNITELDVVSNGDGSAAGPLTLGGVVVPTFPALGVPAAPLQIINNNFPVGYIGFSATNYVAVNTSNSVTLTVLRTNGSYGDVNVQYFTQNGTAVANNNYSPVSYLSDQTLDFPGGPQGNLQTITIPLDKQSISQPNKFFTVSLTNSSVGGVLDTNVPPVLPTTAYVTIIDGNFAPGHLSFTSPTYAAAKGGVATISVERYGGSLGELTVQCGTRNMTASNGYNYIGVTNTLSWGNEDASIKTMNIQTLQDNAVDGNLTLGVTLFSATNIGSSNSSSLILYPPTNATVTILESDSYGQFSFSARNYSILQNAGQVLITVVRAAGTAGATTINFTTALDNNTPPGTQAAQAGVNYGFTNGTLSFAPGVTSQSFFVPVYDTPKEGTITNRVLLVTLTGGSANVSSQFPQSSTVTILDPQLVQQPAGSVDITTHTGTGFNGEVAALGLQPDGSVLAGGNFTFFNQYQFEYMARMNPDGSYDSSFLRNQSGANNEVLQVLSVTTSNTQTNDSSIMVAGNFTSVDGVQRNGVCRLNLDGSVDETFNPGSGADSTISALAETLIPTSISNLDSISYYVAGNFANFNGVSQSGITRLNGSTNSYGFQGAIDPYFNIGQGVTGGSGGVRALAVQADNSVLLGGDFTAFNSLPYSHIIRLNSAGLVDPNFNPSVSDSVRAIAVEPNGQILIGGFFTNITVSNVSYNLNYLARLNANGTVDTNFNVGVGGDNIVLALALDSQQRIYVGGEFTRFSGVTRSGITRLASDGSIDTSINFGSGADGGFVDTLVVDNNDEVDVGGGFSSFGGVPANNFVRLYGGSTVSDSSIEFGQAIYGVLQDGTNAAITLERLGQLGAAQQTVSIIMSTSDYTATNGIDYMSVTTNVIFPLGETFETVFVPVLNNGLVTGDRIVNLNLSSPFNSLIGPQASAMLIITNVNSSVEFSAPTYLDSADVPAGYASMPIERAGDSNTTVSVVVSTGTNGTATPYVNYIPTSTNLVFNPGVVTLAFNVPLLNATNMFSDQTVSLQMASPANTFLGSQSNATLTIAHVYSNPGTIQFSQPSYSVSEGATNAVITVVRTNGTTGPVSVTLSTSAGSAVAGVNYVQTTTNVNFVDGQSSQTVDLAVIQSPVPTSNTTVNLTLSNPQPSSGSGAPAIGTPSQVVLTILTDNPILEDLALGLSAKPAIGLQGQPITYTESVTNLGNSTNAPVFVTNVLSTNVSSIQILQAPGSYAINGDQIVFQLGALAVGQVAAISFTATASSAGVVTNTGVVWSANVDPNTANNAAQVTDILVAPPTLVVTAGASDAFFTWTTPVNTTVQVAYGLTSSYGSVSSLSGPSTTHTILLSGLTRNTNYYFSATLWWNGAGYPAPYVTNGSFSTVDSLILTTGDAVYQGLNWLPGQNDIPNVYGGSYNYTATTAGDSATATATYTPTIPTPGLYNVYTWFPANSSFSTQTPMYVYGATNAVGNSVNQTTNILLNGQYWFPLASNLFFAAGTNGYVTIYNDTGETNKSVVANAMMWTYVNSQDYGKGGTIPSWWTAYYSNTPAAATNYAAYVFGTSPNGTNSAVTFSVNRQSNNQLSASFSPFEGGRIYWLQATTNLAKPNWVNLTNQPSVSTNSFTTADGTFSGGTGYGVFTVTASNALQYFYRLAAQVSTNY